MVSKSIIEDNPSEQMSIRSPSTTSTVDEVDLDVGVDSEGARHDAALRVPLGVLGGESALL